MSKAAVKNYLGGEKLLLTLKSHATGCIFLLDLVPSAKVYALVVQKRFFYIFIY